MSVTAAGSSSEASFMQPQRKFLASTTYVRASIRTDAVQVDYTQMPENCPRVAPTVVGSINFNVSESAHLSWDTYEYVRKSFTTSFFGLTEATTQWCVREGRWCGLAVIFCTCNCMRVRHCAPCEFSNHVDTERFPPISPRAGL